MAGSPLQLSPSAKNGISELFSATAFAKPSNGRPTSKHTSASWFFSPELRTGHYTLFHAGAMRGHYYLPALYHGSCLNATSSVLWRLIDVGTARMTEQLKVHGPKI